MLTSVYYALTDHPNLHHIFPLDFCEKHLPEQSQLANSLLNIAYLMQITNLQISNRNPLDYMRGYIGDDFLPIQKSHLLPDNIIEWASAESMPPNYLQSFVEARLDLIIDRLRGYLALLGVDVFDSGRVQQSGQDVDSEAEAIYVLDGYSTAAP